MAKVICGVNTVTTDRADDLSLGTLRHRFGDTLSIPTDARVLVNGEEVSSEYITQPGDEIEFVKDSGKKGVKIVCGVNTITSDRYDGEEVGEIRDALQDNLSIPSDARAIVDGENVDEDYEVDEDDELEFVKDSGKKGN